MLTLQISQVPDHIYQTLVFKADQAHRTLPEQTLIELQVALGYDRLSGRQKRLRTLQRIGQRQAMPDTDSNSPAIEVGIRQDRDR